jgi:heptaprenyl diphosphate synthase
MPARPFRRREGETVAHNLATAPASVGTAAPDPFAPVRRGLAAVEDLLRETLGHEIAVVGELGAHLLGGGKRLRPALVLLSGAAVGTATERLVPVAAACELTHMATLVHDDVVDASDRRRGVPTVHAKWGVPMSVLIGDHLFARGFALLAAEGDPRIVRVMSDVVSATCTGEIDEVASQWDCDATSLEDYRRRVRGKTGYFIAECCRLGALSGRAPAEWTEALLAYGREVGDCFQIVDDLLDLTASPEVLGKPTGSDLRSGVYTLPVVWTLRGAYGPELRRLLQQRPVGDSVVGAVRDLLERAGALRHTAEVAEGMAREAQAALEALPRSPHREALAALAQELVRRVS